MTFDELLDKTEAMDAVKACRDLLDDLSSADSCECVEGLTNNINLAADRVRELAKQILRAQKIVAKYGSKINGVESC